MVPCDTGYFPSKFQSNDAEECNLRRKLHKLPCCVSSISHTSKFALQKIQLMKDSLRMFLFALCSVSGLAKAHPAMSPHRQQEITRVLLGYMRKSAGVINKPGRSNTTNCATWSSCSMCINKEIMLAKLCRC